MKHITFYTIVLLLFISISGYSQDVYFHAKAKGIQTFRTMNKIGRNQMVFFSKAPLEDFMGTAASLSAEISFDPVNITKTIVGKFSVEVKSMTTGLQMRDEDMQGENWLEADKYPTINFTLKQLEKIKPIDMNRIEGMATGDLTMHGITKSISIPVTLIYMEGNEATRRKVSGDLLVLLSNFSVKFSDYGVKGLMNFIGARVAEKINIEVNIYGTNAVD